MKSKMQIRSKDRKMKSEKSQQMLSISSNSCCFSLKTLKIKSQSFVDAEFIAHNFGCCPLSICNEKLIARRPFSPCILLFCQHCKIKILCTALAAKKQVAGKTCATSVFAILDLSNCAHKFVVSNMVCGHKQIMCKILRIKVMMCLDCRSGPGEQVCRIV